MRLSSHTDWGQYGPYEYCTNGTYVSGFTQKVLPPQGKGIGRNDDLGMTGIRLTCEGGSSG